MDWIIEASDTLDGGSSQHEQQSEKEYSCLPDGCGALCPCSITAYQTC